jgi:hypothetical protein
MEVMNLIGRDFDAVFIPFENFLPSYVNRGPKSLINGILYIRCNFFTREKEKRRNGKGGEKEKRRNGKTN